VTRTEGVCWLILGGAGLYLLAQATDPNTHPAIPSCIKPGTTNEPCTARNNPNAPPEVWKPAGCLEMSNPTADCVALLQKMGISLSFARSDSPAFHYETLWWRYANGKGGEKPNKTVYNTVVLPALSAARKQARNPKENAVLLHESGAIDLIRLYGAYSDVRDSKVDPALLEAFGDATGTTPEQLAKSMLQAADRCELALLTDIDPSLSTKESMEAASVCAKTSQRLHPR
jgi:hypothetical protein